MDTDAIELLMKKHRIFDLYRGGAGHTSVEAQPEQFVITFGDLPQLTFFVELAELCGVPLTSIRTESEHYSGGCETCGYGAGEEITVYVPRNSQGKTEVLK